MKINHSCSINIPNSSHWMVWGILCHQSSSYSKSHIDSSKILPAVFFCSNTWKHQPLQINHSVSPIEVPKMHQFRSSVGFFMGPPQGDGTPKLLPILFPDFPLPIGRIPQKIWERYGNRMGSRLPFIGVQNF